MRKVTMLTTKILDQWIWDVDEAITEWEREDARLLTYGEMIALLKEALPVMSDEYWRVFHREQLARHDERELTDE